MFKIIRSSKLSLKFSNKSKLEELNSFINEYKRVANLYLDYIWDNNISNSYAKKDKIYTTKFNNQNHLELPIRLSTVNIDNKINLETTLTARVSQCCLNQVLSIIRGLVEKQSKQQYIVGKLRAHKQKINRKLRKAVRNRPGKPNLDNLKPELNINCIDFQETDNSFDAFVKLKSFTNEVRNKSINFPLKYHKTTNKWKSQGKQLNSFLLSSNSIDIRFEIEKNLKTEGEIVGADQGIKDILTLSDKQVTKKVDIHKHSLETIMNKILRKKKGSKAFSKAQTHRKNFINWSINQLNLNNIKEIRFEKVKRLRFKSKTSRYMSHWTYTEIKDKLISKCQEAEVLLTEQSSIYRSQRCSTCGFVCKSNRKRKVYLCKNCGTEIDADYNASLNHQQDLPDVPWSLRKLNLNRKGFYWKPEGFFSLTGEEIIVPRSKN